MSTIIKFDIKELQKLAADKQSCVVEKKVTQNIALQPWCLRNLKESIRNILDYKIGKFDKELDGILLSYKNLRIPQTIGTIRNDNADIHFQVQVDYYIFRPFTGATLTGIVNKKTITHLAILVHRVFNVVIPRPTEESGNKWLGSHVHEGQQVTFKVVVLDLYGALPYIRGELDERCIKLDSDLDDDGDLSPSEDNPIKVSYVDFNKTKPYGSKQIGDGLPQAASKYNSNSANSSKGRYSYPRPTQVKTKEDHSESESPEKNKVKRQYKSLNSELKPADPRSKVSKKHKP